MTKHVLVSLLDLDHCMIQINVYCASRNNYNIHTDVQFQKLLSCEHMTNTQ